MNDTATRTSDTLPDDSLASILIRDLVEAYPDTMAILAPLGIDLCCGGGHALGEALSLHGLDQDVVLPQIAASIEAFSQGRN
jgi:iron-sulfur cluster repair protein YtfE (RIC family)